MPGQTIHINGGAAYY